MNLLSALKTLNHAGAIFLFLRVMEDSIDNNIAEALKGATPEEIAQIQNSKTSLDAPKAEVSAATIGRMMGLATITDLKLLDSKVDLLATRMASITMKVDKMLTMLTAVPNGNDLERIDVQIASMKELMRDLLSGNASADSAE